MAQYPFRVVFADETTVYPYVVRANDREQAQRRARTRYLEEHGQNAPGSVGRVVDLTPKQQNDLFLPRIDGIVVSSEPRVTSQLAVDAAVAFLDERRVQS